MKILFTADIHIKLGQKSVPIAWAKNRYAMLFKSLQSIQEECNVFIVGGDTFDRIPSIEELELFFEFVTTCKIPTYIYSGNHEALKKNTTFLTNLKSTVNLLNKKVKIVDESCTIEDIDFIPYNCLKDWVQNHQEHSFSNRILCTHVRGEIPPHVKPEVDLELFNKWDVVLAGDLHSYENSQLNILYPGSPVTTSFHRNNVETGVIILDSGTLKHEWKKLELPQLIRKTIQAGETPQPTDYDLTVYEVEGDISELGTIQDSELIDKKILKKETDTTLILSQEMSLAEEVSEYAKYILQLSEDTIEEVLQELNNNSNRL
jgi:DNA repair exonuclease SbcCD nuclease subunit